jgi:hypothetical protein
MKHPNGLNRRLQRCGYNVNYFQSKEEAMAYICGLVSGSSLGHGSSLTLQEMGLLDEFPKICSSYFPHLPGGASQAERDALTADYYICSVNALSMEGHLVNIDGTGNRVAATCFGPKKLILVVGKNKIVPTLNDAMDRAKWAAVEIAKKYNRNTPCVKTGECEECLSPDCVCSITTIHRKKPLGMDIHIILVDEDLGL